MGFFVGGYLVVVVSMYFQQCIYIFVDVVDQFSSWLDFVIVVYFGYLWLYEDDDCVICDEIDLCLCLDIYFIVDILFIFLVMVEDDYVDGVYQVLVYYVVLQNVGVFVEMYLYVQGGYVFGLCKVKLLIG